MTKAAEREDDELARWAEMADNRVRASMLVKKARWGSYRIEAVFTVM